MAGTIGIGIQDFGKIIENNVFYIDKTYFIRDWWENNDEVTLITRPRRFGKTLTMSMLDYFFSVDHAEKGRLFEGLEIWQYEKYRELQGTFPVINLSFANVKQNNYKDAKEQIFLLLTNLYSRYAFLRDDDRMSEKDRAYFDRIGPDMSDSDAVMALYQLSDYLYRYYGKKVIILLDEYDTPMQEAYVGGYWDEIANFARNMLNASFKTNPYLERGVLTGITRISKESIFSDLNNLEAVTTTTDKYASVFGFTEQEVFDSMDEFGMKNKKEIKEWYDGFCFGNEKDIYNPWSIINMLETGRTGTYWANTSGNQLASKLIREGNREIKLQFESLLQGESIFSEIDEEIVYTELEGNSNAVWSLLLAGGYLKVLRIEDDVYELGITNYEVQRMFRKMVKRWFAGESQADYNDFVRALLKGDLDAMNEYMNRVVCSVFSYFDTAKQKSKSEPEKFYHGFVLGLIVELQDKYVIRSNRESGFGRYDIMLESRDGKDAVIIEFKVFNSRKEKNLQDTVQTARQQIEEKKYEQGLLQRGFLKKQIRKYGFAFCGKEVLIG
ncbi:MAG: AAA family ATPase [Eubacterium sp.]|nr:AAA family ATPase [Eubacterium sp.]